MTIAIVVMLDLLQGIPMVSYRALIGFVWQFMRTQKWIFVLILAIDCLNWPVEAVLWPYILSLAVDVFTRFEGDRADAIPHGPHFSLRQWQNRRGGAERFSAKEGGPLRPHVEHASWRVFTTLILILQKY